MDHQGCGQKVKPEGIFWKTGYAQPIFEIKIHSEEEDDEAKPTNNKTQIMGF